MSEKFSKYKKIFLRIAFTGFVFLCIAGLHQTKGSVSSPFFDYEFLTEDDTTKLPYQAKDHEGDAILPTNYSGLFLKNGSNKKSSRLWT